MAEGASWHNVSKIFGVTAELEYVLRKLTDSTLVFGGTNKSSTSTDTITVEPDGNGSKLTYHADLEMNGAAKKLANDTEKQMVNVLNGLDQ